MIDRSQKPEISAMKHISFPEVPLQVLPNGIPLYVIDKGDQAVSRIDILFTAGQWEQEQNLVASITNLMLKEGTPQLTSKEIAEKLDYFGAWLQPTVTRHNSYISLYSLNRFFKEGLDILQQIVLSPTFPQHEFDIILDRRLQQFKIEQDKVQTQAAQIHTAQMFGAEHPYGRVSTEADFKQLTTDHLRRFHARFYQPQFCKIILTGQIEPFMLPLIEQTFGANSWKNTPLTARTIPTMHPSLEMECFFEKPDALQSAVRMGIHLPVNRSHPDFVGLRVLNTLLGGYFGSRLMSNIREEKGYTYGINSFISSYPYNTNLTVVSQTDVKYTRPLITEVFAEIERLKNEAVSSEELDMVKSYMQGELLRLVDGPFATADAFQNLLVNDLPECYYEDQFEKITTTTSAQISELAGKYLNRDRFFVAIAGKQA